LSTPLPFTESPLARFAAYEIERQLPPQFLAGTSKAQADHGAFGRFERGEIDLERFDDAFLRETTDAGHPVSGRELMSLLSLQLRPAMAEAHQRLIGAGFKTACITNNTPGSTAAEWVGNDDRGAVARVMDSFDVVIESATVGMRKPEPAIYRLACERLSVDPHECVFLDDLGVNLKPAKAMGMQTIKVPLDHWQAALIELERVTGTELLTP